MYIYIFMILYFEDFEIDASHTFSVYNYICVVRIGYLILNQLLSMEGYCFI